MSESETCRTLIDKSRLPEAFPTHRLPARFWEGHVRRARGGQRGQLLSMITLMGYGQPFEGGDYGGWSNTAA